MSHEQKTDDNSSLHMFEDMYTRDFVKLLNNFKYMSKMHYMI